MERVNVLLTILTAKKRFAAVESILRESGTRVLSRNSAQVDRARRPSLRCLHQRPGVPLSHGARYCAAGILTAQKKQPGDDDSAITARLGTRTVVF